MIPETILDHDLCPGTYVMGIEEFIISEAMRDIDKIVCVPASFAPPYMESLANLEYHIQHGLFRLPQATFCIWDTPTCTCGAVHTSYPNLHRRFCGEYR